MRSSFKLYIFTLLLTFAGCFHAHSQSLGSLVINEIMANPNNVASLPAFEYIELYNNSSETIELSSIILFINNNQTSLPAYKIAPSQYIILCSSESANDFARFGNAISPVRWFALTNTAASIRIVKDNVTLDEVSYRDNWYNSSSKRNGGWSLERINPNWQCNTNLNWSATNSLNGGSPGKPNTILDKNFSPSLSFDNYKITNNSISLRFNMDNIYFSDLRAESFHIDNGIGQAQNLRIEDDQIILSFTKNLDRQQLYTLRIADLKMCNITLPPAEFELFEQSELKKNDLIINEILFNPKEVGVDFVELYNNSESPINLQHFKLGNRTITDQFLLLESKQHIAITTNKKSILLDYPTAVEDHIFETQSLPPYPNQQGTVTLFSNHSVLLDSIYYSADMHSSLIIDPKGISLERIAAHSKEFHSASTLRGGATPGYKNSTDELDIQKNQLFLSSKTFSPNGDNFEDYLEINYELDAPDYIISVEIFDEKGRIIKKLAHQNHAGTHGKITWDGKNETGQISRTGHYVLHAQIFNKTGKKYTFKQTFVLIQQLIKL